MNKLFLFSAFILFSLSTSAQLILTSPTFPEETTSSLTVIVDGNKGNKGLFNYATTSDVYVHTGVITSASATSSDWRYVKFNQNFTTTNPALNATYIGGNRWQFVISGGIRAYYGVPAGETIRKIAILFRSGNGGKVQRNADGSDMYITINPSGFNARLTTPAMQPTYNPKPETILKSVGQTIAITGAANTSSNLKLYFNGTLIRSLTGVTTISSSPDPTITTAGTQTIVLEASNGTTTKFDTIKFFVAGTVVISPVPSGLKEGLNYDSNDSTSVTFVLYAPGKNRVSIIGDLPGSNWDEIGAYQMKKSPDGNYWWLKVTGLQPRTEYSFQYLVNGNLPVTDPYVEKIQDPWNDQYIESSTYPNLKPYPTGMTVNVVGTFQIKKDEYTWTTTNYVRPDKKRIVIYELLLRDFVAKHDWKTLADTLNYLKNLGINAIQFMPVNEFEGNNSWGYNPDFYFAVDKYYGPANDFKRFIDICHANGMAVIMDIALNHSFGLSPQVQLYFDSTNNRPSSSNPWFNPVAKHGFNVGYDYNHESLATRYFFSRVVEHWLVNYKIDGFRFDLSKGFTQTQTCDNNGNNCSVGSWSAYDASRVAIWKRYYDTMMLKSPGCYPILEHFADNSEEIDLSNYGFLLWGNMNSNYYQSAMGYNSSCDLSYGIHANRGWSNPHLVTYMESHDEERVTYKTINFGNSFSGYNTRDTNIAPKRMELAHAFLLMIPGPKMIWQFGELAYDSSINFCQNGTISTNCRTDMKPLKWGYFNDPERRNLYNIVGRLNNLRNNPAFATLFTTGNIQYNLGGLVKSLSVTDGTVSIMVIGNFDVVTQNVNVTFPISGTWFNYLNGGTIFATGFNQSFSLAAGEYRVYTNQFVALPVAILSFNGKHDNGFNQLRWTVNSESEVLSYQLERSEDGFSFGTVATYMSNQLGVYKHFDDVRANRVPAFYYRVRINEKSGNYRYSNIIKLDANANQQNEVQVIPNPVQEVINIKLESSQVENITMELRNSTGLLVGKKNIRLMAGVTQFSWNDTGDLPAGIYLLTTYFKNKKIVTRVVKAD